ncbi:MAG: general secretion pathway protein GspK [Sphingobium sp. 32-64-5]|nr:MAG: general secretion pathway protein GspK [Sphingobium sp. 32-64-5]
MADRPGRPGRADERGAALLTVLLLVAVMAVLSAAVLERLTLSTRLSANSAFMDQAHAYADSAGLLIRSRLGDLVAAEPGKLTAERARLGQPHPVPVPGGSVTVTLQDGGNCFNLNSLVAGKGEEDLKQRPIAIRQFTTLMQLLGVRPADAQLVALAAADWIDSDSVAVRGGAEDESYMGGDLPYRTANRMMIDRSELRAVAGVTPAIYNLVRPWICALPVAELSPINVNTLMPQQAPLLAMLVPDKLSLDMARAMIAQRPRGGYGSTVAFWAAPALRGITPPAETGQQVQLMTRWFRAELEVAMGDTAMRQGALYDAQAEPVRLVRKFWGDEG